MGALMAARLVAAGHDLTVWNRTVDKTAPLVEAGATAAATPAEAVAGAEIVISMLFGPDAVREVYANAAEALQPGTIVVELRETLPDGVRLIDAPVKGSLPAASSGELGIYAGAADADLAEAADVLAVLGKVEHVGPTGTGASVKLLVNLVLGSSFVMVAEALALADELGAGTDAALTALEGTAVGSLVPRVRAKLENPGSTQFSLGLAEKDLRLVLGADGLAENDISAVLNHVRGK